MIIRCESCGTRYLIDPGALGPQGRTVRCGRCAHSWYLAPPEDMPLRVDDAVAAPPAARGELPPARFPPPAIRRPPRRRVWRWLAGLVVVAVSVITVVGYYERDRIAARWPVTVDIYRSIESLTGLPLTADMVGPRLGDVAIRREQRGPFTALVVEGRIVNPADIAAPMPAVRIELLDRSEMRVGSSEHVPAQTELGPGEETRFSAEIIDPPPAAVDVTVQLVPR